MYACFYQCEESHIFEIIYRFEKIYSKIIIWLHMAATICGASYTYKG